MKLVTWVGRNGTRHEQNLELQLKIQDAAELAQQNKELLAAAGGRCLTEAQQSHLARAPGAESLRQLGVRELVLDRARKKSVAVEFGRSRTRADGVDKFHTPAWVPLYLLGLCICSQLWQSMGLLACVQNAQQTH